MVSGPATALDGFADDVATLPAVTLADVEEVSAAARFDRKFLVDVDRLDELMALLHGSVAALEVDGSRRFTYRTVYFDDAGLATFHAHRQGRRRRYKIRTRRYDASPPMLEAKLKALRGATLKRRFAHDAAPTELGDRGLDNVVAAVRAQYGVDPVNDLAAVLETRYTRTTLIDRHASERLTIDVGFGVADVAPSGSQATVAFDPSWVIVESKGALRHAAVRRALYRVQARPMRLSKYCVGIGALRPDVAANPWKPALRTLASPDGRHPAGGLASSTGSSMRASTEAM